MINILNKINLIFDKFVLLVGQYTMIQLIKYIIKIKIN